jgi:hypothetical protein
MSQNRMNRTWKGGGSGGRSEELSLKVANSTQKAYPGPKWLRIFHVTDEKDRVCARKT